MARKKKLTRFVVACSGKERQLFKVRDRGEELALIVQSGDIFTDPPYSGQKILEQRYSVHATNESPRGINQIKQTIRLEGGGLIETVLDTKAIKEDNLTMLYGKVSPDLSLAKYDITPNSRDDVVSTGRYNPRLKTLLYIVLIGSLDGPKQLAGSSRYRQTVHDFAQFRLFVVTSFVYMPSHTRAQLFHGVSSAPRFDKGPRSAKIPWIAGFSAKEARNLALEILEMAARVVVALNQALKPGAIKTDKIRFGL